MNSKLTMSQLANGLGGIPPATIANNISRGKIVAELQGKKKVIDVNLPINKLWIENYCERNDKIFDYNLVLNPKKKIKKNDSSTKKEKEEIEQIEINTDSDKDKKSGLSIKKIKLELKEKASNIELKNLQIQKMKGELIPFDIAGNMILYVLETYRTTFLQGLKSVSNIFAQKLEADHEQLVEIQKMLSEIVIVITDEAKTTAISGLDNIVKEYREVRNRGEKK